LKNRELNQLNENGRKNKKKALLMMMRGKKKILNIMKKKEDYIAQLRKAHQFI